MSMTSNFHLTYESDLTVKVDVRDDGEVWVTIGEYPTSVTLFMTEEQAEKLRLSIVVALEEKYYAKLADDEVLAYDDYGQPEWRQFTGETTRTSGE